jgi:hypothetical protein
MPKNFGRCFIFVALFACSAAYSHAQQTDQATQGTATPKAKIEDFAWIAGQWQGEAMQGKFEETWNKPFGGTMMGMFKYVENGNVSFYEILTIAEKDDSLVLRVKHFSADFVGWEEKDKCIEFPLVSVSETEAKFDGLIFKKIDENNLEISVNIKRGGQTQLLKFPAKRVQ